MEQVRQSESDDIFVSIVKAKKLINNRDIILTFPYPNGKIKAMISSTFIWFPNSCHTKKNLQ